MRLYKIYKETCYDMGVEVDRLGYYKNDVEIPFVSRDQPMTIAFTSTSFSIGDWGILSALPKYIKKMYPNSTFVVPDPSLSYKIFKPLFDSGRWASIIKNPWNVPYMIWGNNPYIDHWIKPGNWEYEIFTDHYRIWDSKDNYNEPLVEQILRAFGATDEELTQWDTRPKLYFTPEEIKECDQIINQYVGDSLYGCLLFGGRVKSLQGRWDFDSVLFEDAEEYSHMPVFYYSQFNFKDTEWNSIFKTAINFLDLNLTLKQQLYIKQKAYFNLGYQSGMTDAISGGGSKIIALSPYNEIGLGSNCIKGVKYWFKDKTFKVY